MPSKSQSAAEFIVLASFMLLIILGFFAVTSSNLLEAKEEGNKKIANDIADFAYREIEYAKSLNDGYNRVFVLPEKVNGIDYSINIIDNRELIVNYLGNEHVKFLPSNISGNISKGYNKIKKVGGVIYLNNITQPAECNDFVDNDGDTRIDLNDAGCLDSSDSDETNCGDSVCEGGENCLFCSADCGVCPSSSRFYLRNSLFNIMLFSDDGNAELRGTLQQISNPTTTADNEFVIKNNGNDVAVVNLATGNMVISGSLFENQPSLNPSGASDDLIVRNSNGDVVSYIDDSGNFYLKGNLTQNGNP